MPTMSPEPLVAGGADASGVSVLAVEGADNVYFKVSSQQETPFARVILLWFSV